MAAKARSRGMICSSINCNNYTRDHPGLSFFRFPNDEDRCQQWVINGRTTHLEGKSAKQLNNGYRLCADHFETSQFGNQYRDCLNWNAVPTLFVIPNPPPRKESTRPPPKERGVVIKAKEEKRILADKVREWNKPRDDLLCEDLARFPTPQMVPSVLAPYFGDIVMVVEFLSVFGEHLGLKNSFPDGLTIDVVEKALFESDINGPLSDLLCFFLTAIFTCTEEEEDEEELEKMEGQQDGGKADLIDETTEPGELSYKELIRSATTASLMSQLNHGISLKGFQLDPLTVSEVLRLHLLASGAKGSSTSVKFRYQSRGGYTSLDDAGIELKKDYPHILNSLSAGNVFDLDVADKLTIISTLMTQLLTYASIREIIEESMDQNKSISYELKQVQWAEQRREREEAQLRHKKRLEQKLRVQQQILTAGDGLEKMDTENGNAKPVLPDTKSPATACEQSSSVTEHNVINEKAAKKARKMAKIIINDTAKLVAKLDPNRIPQDTGRSRRKNAPADEFNWRDYDMTDWNNLEERYLTEEDMEILTSRRKEIETRRKQDYIDREAEMYDMVNELGSKVATHPLGQDRWGRVYWSFNSVPNIFIERLDKDVISQPTDLDGSLHSQKEKVPSKQEVNAASNASGGAIVSPAVDGDKSVVANSVMQADPSYTEETNWVYYNTNAQVDELVSVLNNRGYRESALKVKIVSRRRKLQQLSEENPDFLLDEHSIHEAGKPVAATNQNIESRSRIAKGLVQNTSAQESLELNLREMLLDLEERVFVGALGSLKISNRAAWRVAQESGGYSPQDKELTILTIQDIDPNDGDSLVVRDLRRALLQIQRAIESKFLCKPLGFAEVEKKKCEKEEVAEETEESTASGETTTLDRWTESLLNTTSLSQIFLHMCTLESSILWSKSALNARCRLCRRNGDGEQMLLCDMCDRGHHMYCLKPPVKDMPRGNWSCPECRPKQIRSRRISRKKSFYEQEEEEVNEKPEEEEDEDAETDSSVYDVETAGSSEEEPKHPKIKLWKATVKGRSSPASLGSAKDTKLRRSRTSTPEVESARFRRSAAPSPEVVPTKKAKTLNRHSEGSSSRKSKASRASVSNRNSLGSARSNLSEEVAQLAQCEEIVREMMEMEDCWPFLAPVNKREVPDYYTIVKHPMDCQTILSKYKTVKYTNIMEMLGDIWQMFKNCTIYNVTSSEVYKMGERLSKYFEQQMRALRLETNASRRERRT